MAFEAYGTLFGIRTNDAAALDFVLPFLPPNWTPSDEPVVDVLFSLRVAPPTTRKGRRNYNLLYVGAGRIARTLVLEEVLEPFESMMHLMVAWLAQEDHLFVHSGVVSWEGKAIVIPGRSHSGKTTLVSELINAGATYYSDDMAVFDSQGRVHPYPIPLSMREDTGRSKYTPEDFGSQAGQAPLPVGLVVMTRYEQGARWRPQTVRASRALMMLLDHTVAVRRSPEVALPVLHKVVAQASTIKTKRGEAAEVVEDILALVSSLE